MIISQQPIQKADRIRADETLVFWVDETLPALFWESSEDIVVLCIQLDVITIEIFKKIIRPKDFGDLDQLVRIAVTMEKRLLPENH